MSLHTEQGRAALAAAMAEPEPGSLAAATRLRAGFSPDLAAQALSQAGLRRRAHAKFGTAADHLFFTPDALEQATRPAVAAWRAERLRAAGIRRVVDLGCGIGSDAMACREVGIDVVAVELDLATAEHAAANLDAVLVSQEQSRQVAATLASSWGTPVGPGLGEATVLHGDAVELAPLLLAGAGPETCVFVDPARRTERGRTWRVEAFTPPWEFVMELLRQPHSTVVKLGPGVPRNLLPEGVEALWISEHGDVVECSLWVTPDARPGRSALLLPHAVRVATAGEQLEVGPLGRHVVEADGAITRAGALDALGDADNPVWLLAPDVAYLSCDQPVVHPGATCFEVLEDLDFHQRTLKAWVRDHRVGTLEIKKRAVDVDPAELRRRLQPKGPSAATILITPTVRGTRALVVRRITAGDGRTRREDAR